MSCACGDQWIIEAADLRTGRVRSVLHPRSFDFQTTLNRVGQGTLNLTTREVLVRNIWPHLTSIWISRIAGGTATPDAPAVEFGGLVDSFTASDNGATSVGLKTIDQYLHHRLIGMYPAPSLSFQQQPQTAIGVALVNAAAPNGIPLTGVADASTRLRDRLYPNYERKNIGEAIEELTDVIDGVDYELVHTKTDGMWSTQVVFRDYVGTDRNVILQSDVEAAGYGLDVDAKDHATWVDALGNGEESAKLAYAVRDPSNIYPRFDAAPAWPDVVYTSTLRDHALGYLDENREPIAIPSATVRGLDNPDPAMIKNGDTLTLDIDFGAVTYKGQGRVVSTSWAVGSDGPATRAYDLSPLTRASESVLNQVPDNDCEDC